ncbi:MAG: hypothetical protein ACM34K_06555 [Bacillota bacterium]
MKRLINDRSCFRRNLTHIATLILYAFSFEISFAQGRNIFVNNSTTGTAWDSVSFGMVSHQVVISLDSDFPNDTLWIAFSSKEPKVSEMAMLISKFGSESIMLNIQSRFIKTKASALVKRRIIVW